MANMRGLMPLLYLTPQLQVHLHWHHILSFAFGGIFIYVILRALFSPLRHIPGPFLARFAREWHAWQVFRGDFPQTLRALHAKYGPVVRLSSNENSISDPGAVRAIYRYGHGTTFPKGKWYSVWIPPHLPASIFSYLDPIRHASQRRKFANA